MKIYHYSQDDGLLLAVGEADPDPMEEGNWLVPAHATTMLPPPSQEGKTVHFTGQGWEYRSIPIPEPEVPVETPAAPPEADPTDPPVEDPQPPMTYAEKRALEYPNPLDYLDGIVKGDQAQIDDYIQKCLAVKAKYPKPEQGGV